MGTEKSISKMAAEELRKLASELEEGTISVVSISTSREVSEVPGRFGIMSKRRTPFHTIKLYLEDKED